MRGKIFAVFDVLGEYGMYAVIFFLPISKSLLESFAGVMAFCFIVKKILRSDFAFIKSASSVYIALFALFSSLSLVNSGEHMRLSVITLLFKWFEYLAVFFITQDTAFRNPRRVKSAVAVFIFGAFLACSSGLSQYLFGVEFLRHRPMIINDIGIYSITSGFQHFNNFASYLVVVILVSLGIFMDSGSRLKHAIISALLFLSAVCIMLTYSRGGWVSLLGGMVLMLVVLRTRRMLALFMAVLVGIFLSPQFHDRVFSWVQFSTGFDAQRFNVWQGTLLMIKEHPFLGVGIGTFMSRFQEYIHGLYVSYVHNCYLQIWAETGIFSLLSFLMFAVILLRQGIRAFRVARGQFWILGLVCGIFAFLIHSFFDTQFYSLQLSFLFWMMAGVLAAIINNNRVAVHEEKR